MPTKYVSLSDSEVQNILSLLEEKEDKEPRVIDVKVPKPPLPDPPIVSNRKGYWKGKGQPTKEHPEYTGEFRKRGNKKDLKGWCGWHILGQLYSDIPNDDERLAMLTLFKTGGRASEVLRMTREMFMINPLFINVKGAPLFKNPNEDERHFPILRSEFLSPEFEDLLNEKRGPLFDYKYGKLYKMVTRWQEGQWWPHRFRGERATQLLIDYRVDIVKLMEFYKWEKEETPRNYISLSQVNLEDAMVDGLELNKMLMEKRKRVLAG